MPEAIELYNQLEFLALKETFFSEDVQEIFKIWLRQESQRHLLESLIPFISRLTTQRYDLNLKIKKIAVEKEQLSFGLDQALVDRDRQVVEIDDFKTIQQELQLQLQQVRAELDNTEKDYKEIQKSYDLIIAASDRRTIELYEYRELQEEYRLWHLDAISERNDR